MADKKTELMAQFYAECQQKGYTDMTDETQSLKAKVIATDLKLNYGNIVSFYEKAKSSYEQVQKEKAEAERLRAIQQQKDAEERVRRQVNGELLVTLSDRAYESDETTSVRVYIRPDNSIYYTVNNGRKIEGAPKISIEQGGALLLTYHPSQAVYTGATVGGITTGGVHYTQSGYTASKTHSGKGDIEILAGGISFTLRLAKMSGHTCNLFNRDGQFTSLVHNQEIKCYVESDKANLYYESIKTGRLDHQTMMNALSMAADEQRLSYAMCERIINLLGRIVHGQFPPSDEQIYNSAKALENASTSAELNRAIELYNSISDYKDSAKQAQATYVKYEEVLQAEKEQAILEKEARAKKNKMIAAIVVPVFVVLITILTIFIANEAKTSREQDRLRREKLAVRDTISIGWEHVVGIKADGTVVAGGSNNYGQCNVSNWADIIAVSAGTSHTVGLKADGTVVAVGNNDCQQCDVSDWTDIIAISAGQIHTVGLKADGTVVAVGNNFSKSCDVSEWTDIIAISAGDRVTVGLKSNGTVVSVGYGPREVSDWTDIIAISVGKEYTVGLKSDGTVIADGHNDNGQCNVSDWTNITAIDTGYYHTVGLKADGTVVAVGKNDNGQCNLNDWTDIVAISAGSGYTVGVKEDGTVVAVGDPVVAQIIMEIGQICDIRTTSP